jgi:acyl-CoA reductase-like NAD-dependent aldehyde dehydrogenase
MPERSARSAKGPVTPAGPTVERPSMLIGGERVEALAGERFEVRNPATGDVIAEVPAADEADVDRAVDAAKRAFTEGSWPRMGSFERARILDRFADLLEENLDRLYVLETRNNGRPVVETRAQLARLAEWYRYANALLVAQRDATLPTTGRYVAYIQRVPLGVCGLLMPFNHPMLILAQSLSGALAAGNTVVIKPSELTPLTTLLLGDLALEAGIPPGVVNVVTGFGRPAGEAIASHPDVAKVNFTGGEHGGRAVGELAARRFARVVVESGGKTPVIVFDDAPIDDAVNGAAFAGFVAAGQTCIAGSRLLVQESIYDEFVSRLTLKAAAIRVGDPSDESTQMGPVISEQRHRSVLDYVDLGQQEGARLAVGGGVPDLPPPFDRGYFVEPTLLADVDNRMRVAQEEIFGPVLVAVPFTDEEDAIAKANDSRYALGAAVWTNDTARSHRVASEVDAGICWVNDHHRIEPSMPWGGTGASGVGKECGIESFEDFSHQKVIVVSAEPRGSDWYSDQGGTRLN